jgi:hypothetical protein
MEQKKIIEHLLYNVYHPHIEGGVLPAALIPLLSAAIASLPGIITAIKGNGVMGCGVLDEMNNYAGVGRSNRLPNGIVEGKISGGKINEKAINTIYKIIKDYKKVKKLNKK